MPSKGGSKMTASEVDPDLVDQLLASDNSDDEDDILVSPVFSQRSTKSQDDAPSPQKDAQSNNSTASLRKKARDRAAQLSLLLIDDVEDTNELFWHEKPMKGGKRGKKQLFPCRKCHKDMAIGLDLSKRSRPDHQTAVVQYIGCKAAFVGLTSSTPTKQLVPFVEPFGKDTMNTTPTISQSHMQIFLQQLKSQTPFRNDPLCLLIEQYALERMLQRVLDNQASARRMLEGKSSHEESREQGQCRESFSMMWEDCSHTQTTSSEVDELVDYDDVDKKQILREGSVLEYTDPTKVAGSSLQQAKIVAVNAKCAGFAVRLDNGQLLQREDKVKLLVERDIALHNKQAGYFQPIGMYNLQTSGDQTGWTRPKKAIQTKQKRGRHTPESGHSTESTKGSRNLDDSPDENQSLRGTLWKMKLKALIAVTKENTKKRRAKIHMSVDQLDLALRVRTVLEQSSVSRNVNVDEVLQDLADDFEISCSQLQKFLDGDPIKLVKQSVLCEIAKKLQGWLATHEPKRHAEKDNIEGLSVKTLPNLHENLTCKRPNDSDAYMPITKKRKVCS